MTDSGSVNILGFFLYNFDSFCLILFIFTPHHYHQTMHFERKIGAEGLVLQELCRFVFLTIICLYYD